MRRQMPRCFADSAWTITHPELRDELKRRVRSRFIVTPHADESDLVQDALDAALHSRGLLKQLTPPQRSNWFWVVVSRLAGHVTRRRSKKANVVALADLDADRVADPLAPDPASAIANAEQVDAVRVALATLPEAWRKILALRDAHPNDWSVVAADCGLSTGAARALWYRALAGLRQRLLETGCFSENKL